MSLPETGRAEPQKSPVGWALAQRRLALLTNPVGMNSGLQGTEGCYKRA